MLAIRSSEEESTEMEEMDTSDHNWCWFYLAECGVWHMFEIDPSAACSVTSAQIEQCYSRNQRGVMEFYTAKYTYRLDFSVMRQINVTTGKQRPIKRSLHSATGFRFICDNLALPVPCHWERINTDEPYQLIQLGRDTYEFKEVARLYERTMDHPIKSIQRIQNLDLWEFFCRTMEDDDAEEPMDTSETPLFWYYLADCGRWHRFEDDPDNPLRSEDIETYFRINSKGVLSRHSSNCHIEIDFSAMLWTDVLTGGQVRIQRGYKKEGSCCCFMAPPVLWEKVDPTCPYQLIPLSELSAEYQTVAVYVKTDGLLSRSIVSISRIQNMDLWDMYCLRKKQLMRIQGVKTIQEKRLFHGTKMRNVDSICKYNFDLRLAGEGTFGTGIYFAKYATYADKYSVSGTNPLPIYGWKTQGLWGQNTKIIFLARVMVGRSTLGRKSLKKPDCGSFENSPDSCVDNIAHPKIFVIFDPNQIYPEYLIEYK